MERAYLKYNLFFMLCVIFCNVQLKRMIKPRMDNYKGQVIKQNKNIFLFLSMRQRKPFLAKKYLRIVFGTFIQNISYPHSFCIEDIDTHIL